MTGWEISPFEPDGLRVTPLRPPVLPEPARHGEDPSDCNACRNQDDGIWFNDHWRLARIPGVGVPPRACDLGIVRRQECADRAAVELRRAAGCIDAQAVLALADSPDHVRWERHAPPSFDRRGE
jgi:hypothetical protein